jgi:hypothetical protein
VLTAWLLAAGVASAQPTSFDIVLHAPDDQTLALVDQIMADEITLAIPFRNSDLGIGIAWVPVAPAEPPYLFVELFDSQHCGSAACLLFGFRQTGTGWHKVFAGSGRRWTVLPSSQAGHHDIATTLHRGVFPADSAIYRWNGARYQIHDTEEWRRRRPGALTLPGRSTY